MEVDLHMHSHHSNDSRSKPRKIVERALARNIGGIAVTDHNSWEGARETAKLAEGKLLVIPGAEIKTDKGDVLALFIDEEIPSRQFQEVIEAVRSRGGISLIPHPGDSPRITVEDIRSADGLEAFNSTCTRRSNAYSSKLAADLKMPSFSSSDAHMVLEVGNGTTKVPDCSTIEELRKVILKGPAPARMEQSNLLLHKGNAALNFGLKGIWHK